MFLAIVSVRWKYMDVCCGFIFYTDCDCSEDGDFLRG